MDPARQAMVTVVPREGKRGRAVAQLGLPAAVILVTILGAVALIAGVVSMLWVGALTVLIGVVPTLVAERLRRPAPVRAARAALTGPGVVEAAGLVSGSLGAGVRLGRALCAAADHAGVTVIAETRGIGRRRLYQRLGFKVAASGGTIALLLRRPNNEAADSPNPGPAPQTSGSWDGNEARDG